MDVIGILPVRLCAEKGEDAVDDETTAGEDKDRAQSSDVAFVVGFREHANGNACLQPKTAAIERGATKVEDAEGDEKQP